MARKDFSKLQKSKHGKYMITSLEGNVIVSTNDKQEYEAARADHIVQMKFKVPKTR